MKASILTLALLFCGAPAQAAPLVAEPVVHIVDFAFKPSALTIHVGDRVTFVNDDDDAHTVTSSDGAFDSKGLDTHERWEFTFSRAGSFSYFCALHPYMKGTIVVKAAP